MLLDPRAGIARIERTWAPGDRVRLDLGQRPRLTVPDRRVDSLRGCAAVEYGPLVYCVEQADVPVGARALGRGHPHRRPAPPRTAVPDLDAPTIVVEGVVRAPEDAPAGPICDATARWRHTGEGTRVHRGDRALSPLGQPGTGRDAGLVPDRPATDRPLPGATRGRAVHIRMRYSV